MDPIRTDYSIKRDGLIWRWRAWVGGQRLSGWALTNGLAKAQATMAINAAIKAGAGATLNVAHLPGEETEGAPPGGSSQDD